MFFAFVFWVLLCNLLLFLSSRRPPSKNFSRFLPSAAAKVSDDEAMVVVMNPDIGDGRQEGGEVDSSVLLAAAASRYEFSAWKGVSGFVEEPKSMSFVVEEMFANPIETIPWKGKEMLIHEQPEDSAEEEEEEEEPDHYFDVETFMEMELIDERDCEFEFVHDEEEGIEDRKEQLSPQGDNDNSLEGGQIEPPEGLEEKVLVDEDSLLEESRISPDFKEGEALTVENSAPATDRPDQSDDEEHIELEIREQGDLLAAKIFEEEEEEEEAEEEQGKLGFDVQEEDCSGSESDSLWEHDDIVEQLKLELRNVRTGGLSTILEESESEYESPNTQGTGVVLKPMKMENKDRLGEIQKVYKSYAERMRKLDILNYQTLHAIGLIQLKDPLKWNGAATGISSLLSPNTRKSRLRRRQVDPVMESVGGYYQELEMVYIGHVCLSWEILQWQYNKVQELVESTCSYRPEQYNQVAGELQLFRVLLQRFLEDEPFRGSRVENYARTRCVLRSLLQVPVVKDDCSKDKKGRVGDEEAISGAGLIALIEESMRVFQDFLHADKHEDNTVVQGGLKPHRAGGEERCADSDLVASLRTQLQKKERRLKEMRRREGCMVRRLRKKEKGGGERRMAGATAAEVELRVIGRVVKVGRRLRRDQLEWCSHKLERINVMGRMVVVEKEPSFLLFPC